MHQTEPSLLRLTALIPKDPEWSASEIFRMKQVTTTAGTTMGQDPTARIRTRPGPITPKDLLPKDRENSLNARTMPQMSVKNVLNVERSDISAMNAETTLATISTKNVYARGSTHRKTLHKAHKHKH